MNIENLADGVEDFTGNVWKLENGETVLVDVGTGGSWDCVKRLNAVEKVVVTHTHYDHVDNLVKIVERFSPKVYAYEPDNLQVEAEKLDEGDKIVLSGLEFKIFHTPGHKNDSICLYTFEEGLLFTGDLVFPEGGFGRTDLEEGDREALIESIGKLVNLDVGAFYSGHGESVEVDAEKSIRASLKNAEKRESKY